MILRGTRSETGFDILYMNDSYIRFLKSDSYSAPSEMVWIPSFSSKNYGAITGLEKTLTQILPFDKERLVVATYEAVGNVSQHHHAVGFDDSVKIHVRLHPEYAVSCVSGRGFDADFSRMYGVIRDAIDYATTLREIRAGRLSVDMVTFLSNARKGRGIKEMILGCDAVYFHTDADTAVIELFKLSSTPEQ